MQYQVDFEGKLPEWGTCTIEADDREEAEFSAKEYVAEFHGDLENVEITNIIELKN